MYLDRVYYLGDNHAIAGITGTVDIYKKGERLPIDLSSISEIHVRVAYWRKAWAIHRWFISHVDGVDDCRPVGLEGEELVELRDSCEQILAAPEGKERDELAMKLIPPYDGEPTDEWYYASLKDTVKMLDGVTEDEQFEYVASW